MNDESWEVNKLKSIAFVQQAFKEYYASHFSFSNVPFMEKREFGFATFGGWMLRHKGFATEADLVSFLIESVPRDAYFSSAYYEDPETEMEKKGWLGADLVFDIDADHIPTTCDKFHDQWRCCKCNFEGRGISPQTCPVCGGEKFDENTWPCEICLSSAKDETTKLLDMLQKNFGFSEKELRVFFSGHRGYHVHVEKDIIKDLDTVARKEIVDYVCGQGLTDPLALINKNAKKEFSFGTYGWRRRIVQGIRALMETATGEDYRNIGLKGQIADTLVKNKSTILRSLSADQSWTTTRGFGPESLKRIIEYVIKSESASVDTVVTTDTHRLIRLGETLNGKTGLKKTEFPISALKSFDPFKNAIAFKERNATVLVANAPKFRVGDQTFGPYKNSKVELPLAAAILLICRNRAEAID